MAVAGGLEPQPAQRHRRSARTAGADAVVSSDDRARLQRHGHALCGEPLRARPSAAGRRRGAHPAQTLSRRPHVLSRPGVPQGLHRRRAHHVRAAMTDVADRAANDGPDQFIPVRKSDLLSALVEQGDCKSEEDREKFRRLCAMLAAIYHYDYFQALERLRNDYYYFSPEVAPHAAIERASRERCYGDLVQSLEQVLKDASFIELPHAEIGDAHRRRVGQRVEVRAPLDDFREIRFWRRGRHTEPHEVAGWFGLRRRQVEAEVFDDVVLMVAMKPRDQIGSPRELKTLARRKIVPSSVLLKYFRNTPSGDLHALFPNVRVVMSNLDKLMLGLPAITGGIPILLKIYATIAVLFLVIGFYLGTKPSVADKDIATAFAALGGFMALGGFVVQQWVKYQWKSLRYQRELTDNVYYRNINNNAGIFDYLIGAAEDQECKEAFLAYHFLYTAAAPPTAGELDARIEAWLRSTFGVEIDFAVNGALGKLEGLGLLRRRQERLFVSPFDGALAQLQAEWGKFLSPERQAAAK